jgi:hypothetical protein
MKKYTFLLMGAIASTLFSCKEQPVYIDKGDIVAEDTTYVSTSLDAVQDKMFLVEELSGVKCVNCPSGMRKLVDISKNGDFKDRLVITSIHVGTYTEMISGSSIQNFVVKGSEQLLNIILEGEQGKPCASFDRMRLRSGSELLMINYNMWPSDLANAKAIQGDKAKVNVDVITETITEGSSYKIKVKLQYNEAIDEKQALNIYLMENDIIDAMLDNSGLIPDYEFDHVLRHYITPPTGKIILDGISKEKGRVYEYTAIINIDKEDPQQSYWKPENMTVVAFVAASDQTNKRVYQVKEVKLVP